MTATNHSDFQDGNLDKVLEIINRLARKSAGGDYIYRGEPMWYDKVSSSLYRGLRSQLQKFMDVSEIPVATIQNWMLDEAKKFTAYNPEIEGYEILAQLQHYGGETNLVDFSTDYLTALFFACNGESDKNGRVIFLSKSGSRSGRIASASNPANRVIAQKSVFVNPPRGFIEQYYIIAIPSSLKQPILDYLRACHSIYTENIYNDFHGFIRVQALHQRAYSRLYAGMICRNNKDYEQAIVHYTEAFTINPQMAVAYNNLGNVYADTEKYDLAIQNYSKAIDLDPNYAGAYNNLGNVYADTEKYDLAIQNYSKAIDLDPDYAAAYHNLGSVYYDTEKYDLAIQNYSKAIDLDPDYAAAYHNLGSVYYDTEKYDLAIQNYSKAIDLDPNYAAAYHNLGNVYAATEEYDLAIQNYSKAIDIEPDDAITYYTLGNVYANIEKYDLAIQNYSKAIDLDPDDSDFYFKRGIAWLCLSEWENAKSDLTDAISKGGNIKSDFNDEYGSIAEFEQQYGIELPEDIKSMLARSDEACG